MHWPLSPQAHYAAFSPFSNNWVLDAGAFYHITNDVSNLNIQSDYSGPDEVIIGDGSSLPITHVGSTTLQTPTLFSYEGSHHGGDSATWTDSWQSLPPALQHSNTS